MLLATALAVAGLLAGCGGDGSKTQKESEEPAAPTQKESEEPTAPTQKTETVEETTAPRERTTEETTTPRETVSADATTPDLAVNASPVNEEEDEDEPTYDATARVTRVVDGDTIEISPAVDGIEEVRFIGVDTPETKDPRCAVQPYGPEASRFATVELQGQEVGLEFDVERTDRYDRLLAYVYKDSEMFNETLLEEGYAQVATFPPNVRYVDRFLAAQNGARAAALGLWGLSPEELAAQTDRGNGIGSTCAPKATPPPKTKTPTPPPLPTPVPTPTPDVPPPPVAPRPQPVPAAPQGGDVDCSDFGSSAEAQPFLLPGDPNRLDADGDGQACDSLG